MCVAIVHNGRELFKRGFLEVEEATQKWLASRRADDQAYLRVVQRGYAETIASWGPWNELGGPLRKILYIKSAAIDSAVRIASRIAYTNTAKCWSVPGAGNDAKLMNICKKRFPLADLCGILRPSIILVWGFTVPLPTFCSVEEQDERIFRISASNRPPHIRGYNYVGEAPDVWVPKAKAVFDRAQV